MIRTEEKTNKHKYALITGASRGIGAATALFLAGRGYHLFLNARKEGPELLRLQENIKKNGGIAQPAIADISDPAQVRRMFSEIEESCPGIDILINNAGVSHIGLLSDMTDEQWRQIIDTNLSGAFFCCRAAIPHMVRQKYGRIIQISSIWGVAGASCEAAYSASKAGLNGLTRALAKELAPSGISVNAVACGVIDTAMNDCLTPEEKEDLCDCIPAGRFGTVEETAQLLAQLLESTPYMTGQIITMDGGFL